MNKELNRKYAKLLVECGVNLQENQGLVINASIEELNITKEEIRREYDRRNRKK